MKERTILIVLTLLLICGPTLVHNLVQTTRSDGTTSNETHFAAALQEPKTDSWPMSGHDLRHSGYSSSSAPDTDNIMWMTYLWGPGAYSSPAVAEGRVYTWSFYLGGAVFCLDASTGSIMWTYTTGDMTGTPTISDGKVYFGSRTGRFFCLNSSTGQHIWSYKTEGYNAHSFPAVAYGNVYFSAEFTVYCLDAENGTLAWSFPTGYYVDSPAVTDGKVYVASGDGYSYCLNATTGTPIWTHATGGWWVSEVVVSDNRVYVGSFDSSAELGAYNANLYCLDAETGELVWNHTPGMGAISSPAVVDGKVYIGYRDYLLSLDAATGEGIWNSTIGSVWGSPAVADGKVYVGLGQVGQNPKVCCLSANTGMPIWSYIIYGQSMGIVSPPAIAYGKVYVQSADGVIRSFGLPHNVAVISVTPCCSWVYAGRTMKINVTVTNLGNFEESVTVKLYVSLTTDQQIGIANVDLEVDESRTVVFAWDTPQNAPHNNISITGTAEIPIDDYPSNNALEGDTRVTIRILGDINGDYKVDLQDIGIVARAFGSYPDHQWWNQDADINSDGRIDLRDVGLVAKSFGRAM